MQESDDEEEDDVDDDDDDVLIEDERVNVDGQQLSEVRERQRHRPMLCIACAGARSTNM